MDRPRAKTVLILSISTVRSSSPNTTTVHAGEGYPLFLCVRGQGRNGGGPARHRDAETSPGPERSREPARPGTPAAPADAARLSGATHVVVTPPPAGLGARGPTLPRRPDAPRPGALGALPRVASHTSVGVVGWRPPLLSEPVLGPLGKGLGTERPPGTVVKGRWLGTWSPKDSGKATAATPQRPLGPQTRD